MKKNFDAILTAAKLRLLKLHYDSHCGHLGGDLSCIDALMTLFHFVKTSSDRFILSKGHSAAALYVTLWSLGMIKDSDLDTFIQENTLFPAHPSGTAIPGLMFSTGSLGHGPSLAAGLALAAKRQNSGRQVYCLCSDGEWQEGSCWEALTFSIHHRLDNLTILIDQNGLQGFGKTGEIISCGDLTPRLSSYGAHVQHINGHQPEEIARALACKADERPNVLVLDTIKGKDVSFEGKLESHYLPLTEEQYREACLKLKAEGNS